MIFEYITNAYGIKFFNYTKGHILNVSIVYEKGSESVSHSVISDSFWPHGPQPGFVGFPRQEHWSGLPFPSSRDLPNPGIESRIASRFFTTWITREAHLLCVQESNITSYMHSHCPHNPSKKNMIKIKNFLELFVFLSWVICVLYVFWFYSGLNRHDLQIVFPTLWVVFLTFLILLFETERLQFWWSLIYLHF